MSNEYLLKELSRYSIDTFAHIIHRNALLHPVEEAFVFQKDRATYSEYNARVNKLINALNKMGAGKGDVIGILSWNCMQYAEVYGATMKGGFIAAPFNPRLKSNELEYIINNSEANTLFVGPELAEAITSMKTHLPHIKNYVSFEGNVSGMIPYTEILSKYSASEPDIQVFENDPCCIIYTSGTTGVPRGAIYTQRRFIEDSKVLSINISLKAGHRRIQITPLFHIAGNSHFRSTMYTAGCNIICKFFDAAETLQLIQDEKATHMDFVPTHLIAMLNLPEVKKYDISSMEMMWYGASPMPLEVLKKGIKVFGPIFAQGYGQSESGPAISHLSKEDHNFQGKTEDEQKIISSAGQPDIGVQVRIVDDTGKDVKTGENGEIIVHSNHTMVEYLHKPEDTKATLVNGWLYTGDIGHYDEKGYIYIVDRKKDMIITGGENVYPREIEEVLYRHPEVVEAAVIGVPDPYWVERVHAVVVLKQDAKVSPEELMAFCKKQIAGYKAPKTMEIVEALPKNSAGKIMKRELRDRYWKKENTIG